MDPFLVNWRSTHPGRCHYPVLLSGAWAAAADDVVEEFGVEGLDQFLWAHFGQLLGSDDRKDVRDCFLDRRAEQQRLFLEGLGLVCKSAVAEDYFTGSWRLSRRGELSGIKSPTGGVLTASLKASDLRDAASAWICPCRVRQPAKHAGQRYRAALS